MLLLYGVGGVCVMEWIDLSALQRWLFDYPGKEVGVAALTLIGYALVRLVWRQLLIVWSFFTSRTRALNAVARDRTRDGLREGKGIWLLKPTYPPDNYPQSFGTPVL